MKKALLVFSIATLTIACGTKSKKTDTQENTTETTTTTETVENDVLIGQHTREDLEVAPHS
ncbi:hypothetical protein [Joostella sp. CR20]|uniref:hypothetical protein n=1 Tax=Joostella sp. CR20 TaxID=2804312 RepID=UPI00313D2E99